MNWTKLNKGQQSLLVEFAIMLLGVAGQAWRANPFNQVERIKLRDQSVAVIDAMDEEIRKDKELLEQMRD